jgi:hypothetical protein
MPAAQQSSVLGVTLAARPPGFDVVGLAEAGRPGAAGPDAAAVTPFQGQPGGAPEEPPFTPDATFPAEGGDP